MIQPGKSWRTVWSMEKGWKSGEATTSCVRTEETAAGRTAKNAGAADAAVITNQEEIVMKIAGYNMKRTGYSSNFGHTEEFKVYDTEDKKILSSQGSWNRWKAAIEALAVFLKNLGVKGADMRRNRRAAPGQPCPRQELNCIRARPGMRTRQWRPC